jgi:hypothetical protein
MANIETVKSILNKGIRFGAVGRVHPKQIDEAAGKIFQCDSVTIELLEQIGREVAGDRLLFCDVNVEHLNKVLEKKIKAEAVVE